MPGLSEARALGADILGERAVLARWRLGDGRVLALYVNFSDVPVALPAGRQAGRVLFESEAGAALAFGRASLAASCVVCCLEGGKG